MIPLYDTIRSRTVPLVTYGILALNVAVFLYELSLSPRGLRHFMMHYGVVPHNFILFQQGEMSLVDVLLPYLTSMFIHAGWSHILGNMLFLWIFADNVEDRQGPATFTAFYLACGFAAGIAQTIINPTSTLPEIGASGAIAGVLGAYLLYYPGARVVSLLFLGIFITTVEVPAVLYLGFWFLMQFFSGVMALDAGGDVGGVAFWAHIGGFLSGVVLAPFLKRW